MDLYAVEPFANIDHILGTENTHSQKPFVEYMSKDALNLAFRWYEFYYQNRNKNINRGYGEETEMNKCDFYNSYAFPRNLYTQIKVQFRTGTQKNTCSMARICIKKCIFFLYGHFCYCKNWSPNL